MNNSMTSPNIEAEIVRLLSEAAAAHSEYERTSLGGQYDNDWPQWYAAHLLDNGLGSAGQREIGMQELGQLLVQYDEEFKREAPAEGWTTFYARRLASRLQP
jgi:hypothetical protein